MSWGIRICAADSVGGHGAQSWTHDRDPGPVHPRDVRRSLPTGQEKERFTTVVFNRIMVVCVPTGVAYIGVTWEERKAREEASDLPWPRRGNTSCGEHPAGRDQGQTRAVGEVGHGGQLRASVAHEVGTPLHSIAWHVEALWRAGRPPRCTSVSASSRNS